MINQTNPPPSFFWAIDSYRVGFFVESMEAKESKSGGAAIRKIDAHSWLARRCYHYCFIALAGQ